MPKLTEHRVKELIDAIAGNYNEPVAKALTELLYGLCKMSAKDDTTHEMCKFALREAYIYTGNFEESMKSFLASLDTSHDGADLNSGNVKGSGGNS